MDGIGGNRPAWGDLPAAVRAAVEDGIGARVVRAVGQVGGFSPGVAARLELTDGRRVFAKAVGAAPNPVSPTLHRREALVAPLVPGPELLWSYDDGDWVALVFEDVPGRTPAVPWRADEWDRVHAAVVGLSRVAAPDGFPAVGATSSVLSGWRRLAGSPLPGVDEWAAGRLDLLASWESGWAEAAEGDSLVHGDLRADNALLTGDGVVFVDWPHAARGAPWVDLVLLLPSVALQGGPEPWDAWASSPLSRDADPDAVTAVVTAVAGFFAHSALLPPLPGLPALRAFQAAQAGPAVRWSRQRLERSPIRFAG
ncbi:phosphotransferase family protein [Saccharothrix sp. Mg75]|uniref:phosphotransferase family protein n=1 Tax=Saccharothrix sp. Mg75 TaxID=3445357 RepID=UPI003EE91CAD